MFSVDSSMYACPNPAFIIFLIFDSTQGRHQLFYPDI